MVRAIDIQEKLLHLIGWEQNYDTSDLKISDALTASESGLYFQQIHPLLTLQNIACIAPDFKNMAYPEYSPNAMYETGNVVKCGDKLYKAKKPSTGIWPTLHNLLANNSFEYWEASSDRREPDTTELSPNYSYPIASGPTGKPQYRPEPSSASGSSYQISSDARSGNHSLYIHTGTDKRVAFDTKDRISRAPGRYRFTVYAKYKDDNPFESTDGQVSRFFKLGVAISDIEFSGYIYRYADEYIAIDPTDKPEWQEYTFDFTLEKNAVITPVISIGRAGFLVDDISLVRLNAENEESEHWIETNPFSEWLEGKTRASIQKAVMRFCNEKAAQGTHKILCENRTLFEGTGRLVDTVKNKKNLVGFEIIPVRAKGVTTKINKIGLQFTEPGEYTLYLMHSSMNAPVKIIKLNKIRKNSTEWFILNDIYLPYQSADNDAGGSWYLCYFQSELPEGSQAIRKDKDWSKGPCGSCSRNELIAWQAWSKYIEVHPFYVNEELVNTEEQEPALWDVEHNQYTYNNNYGINLEITVGCDITDFIIEQRSLFQDVIAKQVAVDMLREFAYNANVRTNRHSINASRLDILYEVDGDSSSMKKSGLGYQLDMAFNAIKISTSGIGRVCLPCKNNGVRYRVI